MLGSFLKPIAHNHPFRADANIVAKDTLERALAQVESLDQRWGQRFATAEHLKEVSAIFDAVGGVLTVPESQLDAVTAVSGSGPAYFFLLVEALVDAGVAAGLSRSVATDLVVQTMAGSAAMLLERLDEAQPSGDVAMGTAIDTTAAQLRATVTSPGGTTAAGLRELERGGLRAAVANAVEAAKKRSEQLGITSE